MKNDNSDFRVYFISEPNHYYDQHYIFSIRNNNGFKYYLLNLPSEEKPTIELKKVDNSILLLKTLGQKPTRIEADTDDYLKALFLLENYFEQIKNPALSKTSELIDDDLNKIREIGEKTRLNNITSDIGNSDIAIITSTLKK